MKNLILFLFLFQLVTSHSQWSLGDYVDDFDIPTGETFLFQEVKGTKKAKLKKQDCHFFIEHNKKDQLFKNTLEIFKGKFGSSNKVVLEEFLTGEEASYFLIVDKKSFKFFGTAQDHKRVHEKDKGANTGGMGAYSPAPIINKSLEKFLE